MLSAFHILNTKNEHSRQIPISMFLSCRAVHNYMVEKGFYTAENRRVKEDACQMFDKVPKRDTVSWTAIISWHAQNRLANEALELFKQMRVEGKKANHFTFASLMKACAIIGNLGEGKRIHDDIIAAGLESDVSIGTALVTMYAKCNSTEDARQMFDKMATRNVVSWTAMIAGYSQKGQYAEAMQLFSRMQCEGVKPNHFTFVCAFKACGRMEALELGKQLHAHMIVTKFETNVVVDSAIVDFYTKCREIKYARTVFDQMGERNVVSWTTIIAGYAQSGYGKQALKLFREMYFYDVKPNDFTFASAVMACSNPFAFEQGKQLHNLIIETGFDSNVVVGNALLDMYARCGGIEEAYKVFQSMSKRDVISWNVMIAMYAQNGYLDKACKLFGQMPNPSVISWTAMIAGFSQYGHSDHAIKFFYSMQKKGIEPDQFTFASALSACASVAVLEQGKQVHTLTLKKGFESDIVVRTSLVDMYSKCGSIEIAYKVFEMMTKRNVVSWNVMIAGCAQHGEAKKALELFHQMLHMGMKPNDITFVGLLSACSHAGLVNIGLHCFDLMTQKFGVAPRVEHFTCMVDLLGRAGRLAEAKSLIHKMPVEPDPATWGAFLGACRIHGNIELGKYAAERLLESNEQVAGTHVLLSNIYASTGRWADVAMVRKLLKDCSVKKMPGCSWIEVKNSVHVFVTGDRSHPQDEDLCNTGEIVLADEKVRACA